MFNNQALEDQYRVLCILLRLRLHLPSIHVIFFRLGFIVVVVESLFDLTFDWAKAHTHTPEEGQSLVMQYAAHAT